MDTIVLKFGGSSVASNERLEMVAQKITNLYDKNNNKIFMGTWGYNCVDGEILLFSKTSPSYPISLNGLVLKRVLE